MTVRISALGETSIIVVPGRAAAMTALPQQFKAAQGDLSQLGVQRTCVDPPALARLVHRVKGGAQVLQAKGVVVACMEVERLCDAEHMDHARIIAAIERVEQELALLISQVDAFRGAAGSVA